MKEYPETRNVSLESLRFVILRHFNWLINLKYDYYFYSCYENLKFLIIKILYNGKDKTQLHSKGT